MQVMEWMKHLQDFRAQLETWGVTTGVLVFIALIAFVCFLLSAREVTGWFLKTGGLRDEVRALRADVARLQATLDGVDIAEPSEEKKEKVSAKKAEGDARTFRLDH